MSRIEMHVFPSGNVWISREDPLGVMTSERASAHGGELDERRARRTGVELIVHDRSLQAITNSGLHAIMPQDPKHNATSTKMNPVLRTSSDNEDENPLERSRFYKRAV